MSLAARILGGAQQVDAQPAQAVRGNRLPVLVRGGAGVHDGRVLTSTSERSLQEFETLVTEASTVGPRVLVIDC